MRHYDARRHSSEDVQEKSIGREHARRTRASAVHSASKGEEAERLKKRVKQLQAKLEDQDADDRDRPHRMEGVGIDEAKTDDRTSERYVRGVVVGLLQSESAVTYDEVAANLSIESTSHVSRAVTVLEDYGGVDKMCEGRCTREAFNTNGIAEIRENARCRGRTAELMESI